MKKAYISISSNTTQSKVRSDFTQLLLFSPVFRANCEVHCPPNSNKTLGLTTTLILQHLYYSSDLDVQRLKEIVFHLEDRKSVV